MNLLDVDVAVIAAGYLYACLVVAYLVLMHGNARLSGETLKDATRDWRHRHYLLTHLYYVLMYAQELGYLGWGVLLSGPTTTATSVIEHAPVTHLLHAAPLIYTQQLAFYTASLLFIAWRPADAPPAKDAARMVFHHFLTMVLMLGALYTGYARLGIYVMMLHDIADIALYGAMSWHCVSKDDGAGRRSATTAGFWALFVVAFVAFRLVYFPLSIGTWLRSPSFLDYCPRPNVQARDLAAAIDHVLRGTGVWRNTHMPYNRACIDVRRALVYALGVMFLLQLTWFIDIVRMTYRMLTSPDGIKSNDVRSDDDDDQKKHQ